MAEWRETTKKAPGSRRGLSPNPLGGPFSPEKKSCRYGLRYYVPIELSNETEPNYFFFLLAFFLPAFAFFFAAIANLLIVVCGGPDFVSASPWKLPQARILHPHPSPHQ